MVAMVISKNVGVNINLNGSVPNGMREKITIVDQSASSDWINAQITNVADSRAPLAIQAPVKLSSAPKVVDNKAIAAPTMVDDL